jgi:hypothetical protein
VPPETLLPLDGFCISGTNFVCLFRLATLESNPSRVPKGRGNFNEQVSINEKVK